VLHCGQVVLPDVLQARLTGCLQESRLECLLSGFPVCIPESFQGSLQTLWIASQ